MIRTLPGLDAVLENARPALAGDFHAYRGHAYRVANYCLFLAEGAAANPATRAEDLEKISLAAAFHDLGIWTARTFDYLDPSRESLSAWLMRSGKTAWLPEIAAMVGMHHKITPYQGAHARLAEAFRKADAIDLTFGALALGVPRAFIREANAGFPEKGFRRLILRLALGRLREHPLDPLPMFRL